MGYYDQDDPYEPRPVRRRNRWLIPLLLGVVIGVLLVTAALPKLVETGVIPSTGDSGRTGQGNEGTGSSKPGKEETVQVDVTSQVTKVVKNVSPAVVGVTNIQKRRDFWQQDSKEGEVGTGSGVIYKKDGNFAYIVTNNHVIKDADAIEVTLSNNKKLAAKLMGSDVFTDLAVLRVDGAKVEKVIELGSSANVQVGEPAIAIGNPLGPMFAGSVTQGVISGKERTIPEDLDGDGQPDWQAEVLQTDAAINPGNSGGALINISGQLIGINSMKINQEEVEGIGFSIPVDTARPIMNQLESKGKVIRPFLGIESYSLEEVPKTELKKTLKLPDNVDSGIYVWSVEPLSPASKAGLRRLDVITEFGGRKIASVIDLRKVLYQDKQVGDKVDLTYYRDGKKHTAQVTLGKQDD